MTTPTLQTKETLCNLLKTIAPEADLAALPDNADIRQTLEIDSFDFLNFMIAINETFGVEIPETDYGKLSTLADVIHYIEARVA